MRKLALLAVVTMIVGWSAKAEAFCGFYVGGAGAKLFNNATLVVMMRDGKRTVLSMQNNYQGPPSNFALVVPVPVVLQKDNVKTLPAAVFDRVDKLAAPRLVEYWEQDPCYRPPVHRYKRKSAGGMPRPMAAPRPPAKARDLGVTVEAQFEVGEYEIVILSAKDSTGLNTWLKQEKYNIPDGAEPALRPYVQQGMKFFVAKVNSKKVKFERGQVMLSPLRFYYDSDLFNLPVRLGMLNSKGTQDLIVHILAPSQRYEVANYDNITIPTNFDVSPRTKKRFGEFYAALFDEVTKTRKRAVVTEYAWQATGCDPCPGPPLGHNDFATLGGDVLPSTQAAMQPGQPGQPSPPGWRGRRRFKQSPATNFVLTRLHARYDKNALAEDLVFKKAPPIIGGREMLGANRKVERGAKDASFNNFQARYVIRHAWSGPIACANPIRGRWGGPPPGVKHSGPQAAQDLAFAPRGKVSLKTFVSFNVTGPSSIREKKNAPMGIAAAIGTGQASPLGAAPTPEPAATGVDPSTTSPPLMPPIQPPESPPAAPPQSGGCGACAIDHDRAPWGAGVVGLLLALLLWRRRDSCGRLSSLP
jgi:hypothetical protein